MYIIYFPNFDGAMKAIMKKIATFTTQILIYPNKLQTKMIKSVFLQTLLLLSVLFISCSKDNEEAPDITLPTVNFSIKGLTQTTTEVPPIIGNTIEIEINAQDATGISKVEAFLDDTKVGEDTDAPFKITIDLTQYTKKLSGKGTVLSKMQTQYTLKVSATDLSGNTSTIEKDIIVDNEVPTITEVSLENNSVIAGEENQVTFKAGDNEGIISLEVKVNEVVAEATALDSITYAINIDTSVLEDGQNNLIITASDQAANIATYDASFLVDNTGPEITLEGLTTQDSIVDESTVFSIIAVDLFSDVDSLKIFINDSIIMSSDIPDLSLDFNPDEYATGNTTLRVSAIDALGNESTQEVSFVIKRLLLKISIPDNFLDPSISEFYVFASKSSGELLDIKPLKFNTSLIKLNTFADVSPDTEYMLNFAYLYSGVGVTTIIKTIQNVKRSTLDRIDLKIPERKSMSAQNTYQVSEMPTGTSIVGEGSDYNSNYDPGDSFYIEDYNLDYTDVASNQYYIYNNNTANNNYDYQFVDKPMASDFYLDYNNFITDGVETRYFNSSSIQDPDKFSNLYLYGYLNATDLENGIKHRIWANGKQNVMIMNGSGYRYSFNTNFYNYSYKATMENYRIEAIGEPLEYYNAPDWSIDYTYSSTNKTFSLNKSGTTHNIGKIAMDLTDNNSYYTWTVLFDSQTTNEVVLPELPKELQSWNINNYYTSGDLNIEQIEVKRYDGLDTYDSFLQTVIKNNEFNQLKVSDKIESVFKSNVGAYISRPDFSFIY